MTDTEDHPTFRSNYPVIDNLYICKEGITKLIQCLKVISASGPKKNIAKHVLKHSAKQIALISTFIFDHSLSSDTLPDWLKANVAPISQKRDKHAAENYHPVSLTIVCSKLMEHVICKHIHNHLHITQYYQQSFKWILKLKFL